MAYQVRVVPSEPDDSWGAVLQDELERQEAQGWQLCAMTTTTVALPVTGGMGAAAQYAVHFVLVLHKAGDA